MEFNHPDRICCEETCTLRVKELHASAASTFCILRTEALRCNDSLEDSEESAYTKEELEDIESRVEQLAVSVTKDDIVYR